MRAAEPGLKIIAHPECPPDVIAAADFTGSTSAMIDYVKTKRPRKVVLVTECSMASNVAAETPDVEFVRPCNLCPHMKRISLESIYDALLNMRHEVTVDPAIAVKAPPRGRTDGRGVALSVRRRGVRAAVLVKWPRRPT